MADESAPARYCPSPDAVAERLGDELVLVHMKTDRIFVLNGTGARIWELMAAGHDSVEIRRRLLQEYEAAESDVAAEVGELLESLRKEDLINPDG